jgi:hypothetical protein
MAGGTSNIWVRKLNAAVAEFKATSSRIENGAWRAEKMMICLPVTTSEMNQYDGATSLDCVHMHIINLNGKQTQRDYAADPSVCRLSLAHLTTMRLIFRRPVAFIFEG